MIGDVHAALGTQALAPGLGWRSTSLLVCNNVVDCMAQSVSTVLTPTQVVYVREAVSVWPSRGERITGRLSLVRQHCVTFLAWLPYSRGTLRPDGTFHVAAYPAEEGSATGVWIKIDTEDI